MDILQDLESCTLDLSMSDNLCIPMPQRRDLQECVFVKSKHYNCNIISQTSSQYLTQTETDL